MSLIYTTIDLCAGIGGIRRGFEITGHYKNILTAEIDISACKTYSHLFKEDMSTLNNDITQNEFKERIAAMSYDILLAGFPCQPFSMVGKKEGLNGHEKSNIFSNLVEIMTLKKPKAFLLENVVGLLNIDSGNTFKSILNTLIHDLNYCVVGASISPTGEILFDKKDFILNTENFGLPQHRPRVFIIGFDSDRFSKEKIKNTITPLPQKRSLPNIFNSLHDVIELGAEKEYYMAQGYLDTLKKHKEREKSKGNGFSYEIVYTKDMQLPIANTILATGGSGKERNLVIDIHPEYENNYKNKFCGYKKTPINNEGVRVMTPNEWAKLQGFMKYAFVDENGKDNFSFPSELSKTEKYKQLGNSVSIPLIEELALYIHRILIHLENKST